MGGEPLEAQDECFTTLASASSPSSSSSSSFFAAGAAKGVEAKLKAVEVGAAAGAPKLKVKGVAAAAPSF